MSGPSMPAGAGSQPRQAVQVGHSTDAERPSIAERQNGRCGLAAAGSSALTARAISNSPLFSKDLKRPSDLALAPLKNADMVIPE